MWQPYKHDAEIYNLASAETARRAGNFGEAMAAASLTAHRAPVKDVAQRTGAVRSLLRIATSAHAKHDHVAVVNALASASEHTITIHRADREQTASLNRAIAMLATKALPHASKAGKEILGHIMLEHTEGRAVNGHGQQQVRSGNRSNGRAPTMLIVKGRLAPTGATAQPS